MLARLAEVIEEVDVKSGDEVIKKDDHGDSMYIVVEGKFKVHDGDKVFVEFKKNDVFGELSALLPERRIASVTAVEDGILLMLDHDTLKILLKENAEIAIGIIKFLTMRLREELAISNKQAKNSESEEE